MRTWFFPAGKEPIDLVASSPQPDMCLGSSKKALSNPSLHLIFPFACSRMVPVFGKYIPAHRCMYIYIYIHMCPYETPMLGFARKTGDPDTIEQKLQLRWGTPNSFFTLNERWWLFFWMLPPGLGGLRV